jgi:hypothetical protein
MVKLHKRKCKQSHNTTAYSFYQQEHYLITQAKAFSQRCNKVGETIFLTSRDRFAASSNVSPLQARSNFSQDPHFGESAFCCYFCDAYPVETGQEFRVHPSPAHLPPPQILRMPKCRRPVAWNAWMQFCCKLTPILFYFRQTMCINFQPRQAKHKKNMK